MKFSIVIPELTDLEKNASKLSELGYRGIELNIRDPREIDTKQLMNTISSYGLNISSIITGKAFTMDGLSFVDPDEHARNLAIRRVKDHISLASTFSAVILIGYVRGKWKDDKEKARRLFIESLWECGRFAKEKGVLLVVEPINRYEVDSIHTLEEAISIVKEISLPNLGIVADTFHMNIEETKPIYKAIQGYQDHIFHVHIADNNRKPPGKGCLPFKRFFNTLKEIGYSGFVSVEVVPPLPDSFTVAEESMRYIRKILFSKSLPNW